MARRDPDGGGGDAGLLHQLAHVVALLELLLNEESAPAVLAEADLEASPLG
ncbi:MAG: hypothetical protein ACTHMW_06490 [Actinomycetes bacterium]